MEFSVNQQNVKDGLDDRIAAFSLWPGRSPFFGTLPLCFVKKDCARARDVKRIGPVVHRNGGCFIAGGKYLRRKPNPFVAKNEAAVHRKIRLPDGFLTRVRMGCDDASTSPLKIPQEQSQVSRLKAASL